MLNKFRLGSERNKTLVTFIPRSFAGECKQITWHTLVKFFLTQIERSTFYEMQVVVVVVVADTCKPLDNVGIISDGQLKNMSVLMLKLHFP